MFIYFFTILLFACFSWLNNNYVLSNRQFHFLLFISYCLLVVQVGLRWETGTDWYPYLDHFNFIDDYDSTSPFSTGFEFGYNLFVWVFKFFSQDYSLFLFVHAIIFYFLIIKAFKSLSSDVFLALMLFYSLFMGLLGSNRQLLALAICLYSIQFVFKRQFYYFIICVFIATLFHTTSLIFIVYYFINREIKPAVLFTILLLSFILGKSQFSTSLFSFVGNIIGGNSADKANAYIEFASINLNGDKLSIIGIFKRVILLSTFYFFRKKLVLHFSFYNLLLNGYIFGIIIYLLFSDFLLIMVSRGSIFFNVMEPLLLTCLLYLFSNRSRNLCICTLTIIAIIFFFQSISTYPDLFLPYKGLFFNSDYKRIMH